MSKTNHTCKACGAEYLYCDDCGEFGSYKTICDTEDCYKIFLIAKNYDDNADKEAALEALKNIGFDKSKIKSYIPSIRKVLNEIYKFDEKETPKEAVIEEGKEIANDKADIISKPKYYKSYKNKND